MVRLQPEERYKDIFEVKKSFLKLFSRLYKTNRVFVFEISTGKIDNLRDLSLGVCASNIFH